jgi:hypothetical protein
MLQLFLAVSQRVSLGTRGLAHWVNRGLCSLGLLSAAGDQLCDEAVGKWGEPQRLTP